MVCEVICYRGRLALREVGKALGLSLDQVDRLAKVLDGCGDEAHAASVLREAGLSAGRPAGAADAGAGRASWRASRATSPSTWAAS